MMSTGATLGAVLFVGLVAWLLFDLILYMAGKETFSQWVIKQSSKNKVFARVVLFVILCGAALLLIHFETFHFIWND